eukprot:886424-Alexandrium_andersonii.AAC.1
MEFGAGGISGGASALGGSTVIGGINGLPAFPFPLAFGEGGAEALGSSGLSSAPPALGGDGSAGGATLESTRVGTRLSRGPRGSPDE